MLDASALLCFVFDEPGAENVEAGADGLAIAQLRLRTRRLGLSLGDRACVALAQRLELPALTCDRAWAHLDVGVAVELVR